MSYLSKNKLESWVRNNRLESLWLALILLVGAFFRLYRIDEYLTFLGDEGRDVIIVRRLLVNFDPILIGPRTSIGDMYLGPLYYYLMAPFLLIANFSPAGPAVMIALLGVATILFVWLIAREWFGRLAAFIAALFYAISPVVIVYSRSSWNPNIMPFFALLCIFSVWKLWQSSQNGSLFSGRKIGNITLNNSKWLIVLAISYAFVLQSHYLGLLLLPTISLFYVLTAIRLRVNSLRVKKSNTQPAMPNSLTLEQLGSFRDFIKHSFIGLGLFLLLMSPLVIFDARHGWRNFSSMKRFFTERQTTVSARPWTALPELPEISTQVFTRLISGGNESIGKFITIVLTVFTLWLVLLNWRSLKLKVRDSFLLILIWIGVAFLGLGLYKQHIYDHYYGFFFAGPFLLIGGLTNIIVNYFKKIFFLIRLPIYFLFVVAFLLLLYVNLARNPLKYPPNRQLQRTVEVAEKIVKESSGKKLNLAVLAERNYEDAYQYFLEKWRVPFVEIDPQRADETIAEQLFVVCELADKEECDPTRNPKAEIANFGWSKIENEWQVAGVTLYKLTHSE